MDFYTSEKITESTTCITDITKVHAFLIEGRDRAVLVDTCNGAGNLREYIDGLLADEASGTGVAFSTDEAGNAQTQQGEARTQKPLDIIVTHGHCDHAGGSGAFDNVYLNRADWELTKRHNKLSLRQLYVNFCVPDLAKGLTDADYAPEKTDGFLELRDGMTFDLGGVVLQMITLPGHTSGMTCVLNVTERYVIFGDGCNPGVFLWDEEALPVRVYRESLLKMKQYEAKYDRVLISHGNIDVPKKILDEVIEVCDDILAGRADNVPFKFMDFEGLLQAKAGDYHGRADGKLGNIIYRAQ